MTRFRVSTPCTCRHRRATTVLLCLLFITALLCPNQFAIADTPAVVKDITHEVSKKNHDPGGWPLPVVSHWANGFGRTNFSSEYQIELLERGHHVVPTLPFPQPGATQYGESAKPWVEKLAVWRAPISLRAGQWESVLYSKEDPRDEPGKWRNLSPAKSPLEIDREGKLTTWLSPWGAVEPWYEAGVYNTASPAFEQLQQWYPNPPRVILLSNNEARVLKPKLDIEAMSKRFVDAHGTGHTNEYIRREMAEGYLERYRALLKGIRDGLQSPAWREHSLLVGYGNFGPPHFGRMDDWAIYSYTTDQRIAPWHLVWDGGSPSYYTHNWNPSTDYRVWSPQVEANNWVFMLEETYAENPDFWFEMSVWDGNVADASKAASGRKMDEYLKAGQKWSPERYAGFVQFGMWLLRPRVVREFRGSTVPRAEFHQDFEALVAAVDRVWDDPALTEFWRHGQLVPNRSRQHPYQVKIPEKWQGVDRWFLLNTNLDPPGKWELTTEVPVFALARVMGEPGQRDWLLYAHSPLRPRDKVEIELPEYGNVTVNVNVGGSFYLVHEKNQSVRAVRN